MDGTGASAAVGGADEVGDSSSYAGASRGRVGPDAAVGEAVYAGGGSFEGTVKAFMPGLSGRLVGTIGLAMKKGLCPVLRWLAFLGAIGLAARGESAVGELVDPEEDMEFVFVLARFRIERSDLLEKRGAG